MTPKSPPLIVFSDLDGTLLDHRTYDHRPAQPALDRLEALGIPLILASSKTAAEIAELRHALGRPDCPAIVENGAGILEPDSNTGDGQGDYPRLRAALAALPNDLRSGFVGFADLGVEGVARVTGLAPKVAERAAERRFSEPGLWQAEPEDLDRFLAALAEAGVTGRRGGRFLTLSFGGTKADRMGEIAARFGTPPSVAAGDAPNDREMLETADYGIIVANLHGNPLPELAGEAEGRVIRTREPGPAGWNIAMLDLLEHLDLNG